MIEAWAEKIRRVPEAKRLPVESEILRLLAIRAAALDWKAARETAIAFRKANPAADPVPVMAPVSHAIDALAALLP